MFRTFQNLVGYKSRYIIREFERSWSCINFSKNEPEVVRDYLLKGLDYLNSNLASQLSNKTFTIKFAGVFVHQKPYVRRMDVSCSKKLVCELGDLLTLFLFVSKRKQILLSKAFLSQAKKYGRDIKKKESMCQYCLYERGKAFEYTSNNFIGRTGISKRKLPTFPVREKALNYLVLNEGPGVITSVSWYSLRWSWVMTAMLMGLYGLRFRGDFGYGWSRIVWDLIEITGKSFFRSKPRGNYLKDFLNMFNDFENYDNFFREVEGEGQGIPILFLIVQTKEL